MDEGIPSRTALRVALRRPVHQIRDTPLVFEDPVGVTLLDKTFSEALRQAELERDRAFALAFRAFLVAGSRYAEDILQRAFEAGIRQYVLFWCRTDTFAYRNPYNDLRVFEVDHPGTQKVERDLLGSSSIRVPQTLTFVPVDFERQGLAPASDCRV